MTTRLALAPLAAALAASLSFAPAAQATDAAPMSKMSDGMHKPAMKDGKKHKDSMMKTDAMKGGAMKKDETTPAQ